MPQKTIELAKLFHETYERLAPTEGYETRPDTKEFDPESKNGRLMVATVAEVQKHLADHILGLPSLQLQPEPKRDDFYDDRKYLMAYRDYLNAKEWKIHARKQLAEALGVNADGKEDTHDSNS